MTKPITWFGTWLPLIKLAQAVCLSIVILMFLDGREQWTVYTVTFFFAFLATLFSLLTILLRYFEANSSREFTFNIMELSLNAICTITCFVLSCILLWDIWNMRQGAHKFKYHTRLAPVNIGQDAWIRRCGIVAITLLLAGILFLVTYLKIHRSHR